MDKTVNIDGLELHYTERGSGAPIVLMHGWGCKGATLDSIAAVAEPYGRVLSLDFPGFGDTPEPPEVWGVEQYTLLVEKWLRTIGAENPVLLGHSFGGRVGILYASRNPVRALILTDAAGVRPRRGWKYYYRVYTFKLGRKLTELLMGRDKAQARIEQQRKRTASADYLAASPRMRQVLSKVVNEDLCHVMPLIQAPTLLIWGSEDTATPAADARRMEQLIPGAGLVIFDGAGHYSFLDCPGQYAAVLRSFLSSLKLPDPN